MKHERERERERHGTAFVVGATLGGVVGAVWGLLNATETGEQARAALGGRLEAGADWLVVAGAELEVTARQWLAREELAASGGEARELAVADGHAVRAPAPVPALAIVHDGADSVFPEVAGGGPDEVIG